MRLLLRHSIALLLFFFVFRLALQAQEHQKPVTVPKSVLLSRLSDQDPIPSRAYEETLRFRAAQALSEGLVDR